jgi:hypothetical protein
MLTTIYTSVHFSPHGSYILEKKLSFILKVSQKFVKAVMHSASSDNKISVQFSGA